MILKGFAFLLFIIILDLQTIQAQDEDIMKYLDVYPCCPKGNILINTGCLHGLDKPDSRNLTRKGFRETLLKCPYGMYLMDSDEEPEDFHVKDGSFYLGDHLMLGQFCLTKHVSVNDTTNISELNERNMDTSIVALICFPSQEDTFLPPSVSGILAFISVGFLVLTIIVYAVVPQLRDLQGKCIMCTAISLCIGFFHLALAQIHSFSNPTMCQLSGFLLYFWILGAFFWMNVVSFNVMRITVKTMTSDARLFLYYSIYGWGAPLFMLIVTIIADNVEGDHIKPGIGTKACWFTEKLETWSYFYGPMAALIICNTLLFIITSFKLWKQTSYENVTKIRSLRYKFLLYLKIFLVMGISWSFEILSFIHDTRHVVWLITDTFNSLQGLVFFLVLVLFRKRALKGLAAKGFRLPCAPNAHTGLDEECDEFLGEEEAPALTTLS